MHSNQPDVQILNELF